MEHASDAEIARRARRLFGRLPACISDVTIEELNEDPNNV
jgi:hypothetical protein